MMKKKLSLILAAVACVFSFAGQAAAAFQEESTLVRVVYSRVEEVNHATDLGVLANTLTPATATIALTANPFDLSMFPNSTLADLQVAYFALDNSVSNNKKIWVSGPESGMTYTGGATMQNVATSIQNNLLNSYETLSYGASYLLSIGYNGMSVNYEQYALDSFFSTIPGIDTTEANLADLATVGYVEQTLYYMDPASEFTRMSGVVASTGVVIRTLVDGTTVINPSAVPLPGAFWLLGSGLVGLIGIRRKNG
ncbi:MAG: VPLPA-CTERM sorting domain-containing protein [Deltaproteobacteria bacterium]|nr:VPLPA-CTERM sorting domain-containing protein [Deltaproteobacteria bacterium]